MTEVDIWIKVLDRLGFKFIDEYCGPGDINHIKYSSDKDIYSLYFNRKTDEVKFFHCNHQGLAENKVNKQTFYNQYKDIFRQIKLEEIV